MSVPEAQIRRNRAKFLLLVALFLVPPVAAWVAWQYLGAAGVQTTTNAGTLVSPARPLAIAGLVQGNGEVLGDERLRGRWTYVMFASNGCDRHCQQQLYLTRQIRLGMNKDIRRVQRLLVLDAMPDEALAQQLAAEHEDLVWAVGGSDATPLLERFRGQDFAPDGAQCFLVDPLGNLMMYYDPDVPAKGMIQDLRKLLKVSQIG